MSEPSDIDLDILGARGAVIGWEEGVRRGLSDEENLNLAAYAAEVIPRLCDAIEALRRRTGPPDVLELYNERGQLVETVALAADSSYQATFDWAPRIRSIRFLRDARTTHATHAD